MKRDDDLYTRADFDVAVIGGGPSGAISALKCAEFGLNVLLMEKEANAHKPCGGLVTPNCERVLRELLKEEIPSNVMCSPAIVGVHYVPTGGMKNGGCRKGYKLLNVNRYLFDQWLRQFAVKSGVNIWYGTEFLKLLGSEPIRIVAKRNDRPIMITTNYLIGADGLYSRVRSQLYPGVSVDVAPILQEYWKAESDFEDCFYVFFGSKLTSAYGYVIPKDGLTVVGIWVPKEDKTTLKIRVGLLKKWLREGFSFKPCSLEKSEVWAVPYGFILEGIGNIVLVGDAAGFCNTLTGEGIKLAVESAIAAGNSVRDAVCYNESLASIYRENVSEISSFLDRVHQLAINLTDEERKQYIDFVLTCN